MSVQPDSDRRLSRTSGRLARNGGRLLALGVALYVIGAILLLTGATTAGLLVVGVATPPTIGAVALLLSGATGKRFANHRDWA